MIRIRIVPPHSVHRRGKPTQERQWMIIILLSPYPFEPDPRARRWMMVGFVSGLTLPAVIRRFRFATRKPRFESDPRLETW